MSVTKEMCTVCSGTGKVWDWSIDEDVKCHVCNGIGERAPEVSPVALAIGKLWLSLRLRLRPLPCLCGVVPVLTRTDREHWCSWGVTCGLSRTRIVDDSGAAVGWVTCG